MEENPKSRILSAIILDEQGDRTDGQLSIRLPVGPKLYNWIHCFTVGLAKLANLQLNKKEASLVFFILSQVDWENRWIPDSGLVWAVCGIWKSDLSKVTNKLVEKGILERRGHIGRTPVFALSPMLGWKGSANRYPRPHELRLLDNQFDWSALTDLRPVDCAARQPPVPAPPQGG